MVTDEGTFVFNNSGILSQAFEVTMDGNPIEIAVENVKRIMHVDESNYVLELRDGRQFTVQTHLPRIFKDEPNISVSFYDDINQQYSDRTVYYTHITELVFDDQYGNMRRNPNTGRTYPYDYLFDPYDQTPLELYPVQ